MTKTKEYGEEWKNAMMRHTKQEIIDILQESLVEKTELIRKLKRELSLAWGRRYER